MALLEIDALSVRFGGVAAVTDVSLTVGAGEIHGIIGPNGAGKTSLINAVTGMVAPLSGSIRFAEKEIAGVAPHLISSLGLGRTFQHVELFGDRSVFDNVLTGFYRHQPYGLLAAALRLPKAVRSERKTREQARMLIEAFDLTAFTNTPAGLLPFGIQKRVDIARALAAEPRLLLLDEPVSGMSEAEAEAAVTTMRKLAREHGITLVVAKSVLGLLDAGVSPADIVHTGADFGTTYRGAGWGAGLTVLVAMANLFPHLDGDDRVGRDIGQPSQCRR
jgi:branched-chain amino acid transport system ATP-binding protein